MGKITLWHVSPAINAGSIYTFGIVPKFGMISRDFCAPKYLRAWFVRWYGLPWAILHIAFTKRVPVWQLAVFRVNVRRDRVTHFNRNVFTTTSTLYPSLMMSAEDCFKRIERQRRYVRSRNSGN